MKRIDLQSHYKGLYFQVSAAKMSPITIGMHRMLLYTLTHLTYFIDAVHILILNVVDIVQLHHI